MGDNIEDYALEEFLPPDESQIEWLVDLATNLLTLSNDERLSFDERNVLSVSSRQILRLLSMCLAGFHLYSQWRSAALALIDEITKVLSNKDLCGEMLDRSYFPSLDFEDELIFDEFRSGQ